MTFSEFKASLIEGLKKNNVEEYEIYYSSKSESTVETLNREISAFSSGVRGGVCLRVRVDNKIGYAATEYFSADEAEELFVTHKDTRPPRNRIYEITGMNSYSADMLLLIYFSVNLRKR